MELTERMNGDVFILAISGSVEGGPDIEVFRSKTTEILGQGRRKVIFDFSGVPWINSTGIGIILGSITSITNVGGTAKFLNVTERVMRIFVSLRIREIFEFYNNEEEAVSSYL